MADVDNNLAYGFISGRLAEAVPESQADVKEGFTEKEWLALYKPGKPVYLEHKRSPQLGEITRHWFDGGWCGIDAIIYKNHPDVKSIYERIKSGELHSLSIGFYTDDPRQGPIKYKLLVEASVTDTPVQKGARIFMARNTEGLPMDGSVASHQISLPLHIIKTSDTTEPKQQEQQQQQHQKEEEQQQPLQKNQEQALVVTLSNESAVLEHKPPATEYTPVGAAAPLLNAESSAQSTLSHDQTLNRPASTTTTTSSMSESQAPPAQVPSNGAVPQQQSAASTPTPPTIPAAGKQEPSQLEETLRKVIAEGKAAKAKAQKAAQSARELPQEGGTAQNKPLVPNPKTTVPAASATSKPKQQQQQQQQKSTAAKDPVVEDDDDAVDDTEGGAEEEDAGDDDNHMNLDKLDPKLAREIKEMKQRLKKMEAEREAENQRKEAENQQREVERLKQVEEEFKLVQEAESEIKFLDQAAPEEALDQLREVWSNPERAALKRTIANLMVKTATGGGGGGGGNGDDDYYEESAPTKKHAASSGSEKKPTKAPSKPNRQKTQQYEDEEQEEEVPEAALPPPLRSKPKTSPAAATGRSYKPTVTSTLAGMNNTFGQRRPLLVQNSQKANGGRNGGSVFDNYPSARKTLGEWTATTENYDPQAYKRLCEEARKKHGLPE